MKERSILNGHIPTAKCKVVQNGIEPVECTAGLRERVRADMDIAPGARVVITTGRVHSYKRFDFVLESARRVIETVGTGEVVFLLVGDGPALATLREAADRLNLGDAVRVLGRRSDVRDLLCAADLAFHAALGEAFSLSILEYMSAGLPVVVPDIPSVKQAIEHDVTGLVYRTDSHGSAADAVVSLVTNHAKRRSMGAQAAETVSSRYTLIDCLEQFRDAVREH